MVRVIGEYVPLKKAGQNFKGLCPFHSEKTPSFIVSPKKGIYHCFGCGVGGNVFNFIMKFKGLSFPEAVRFLGDRVGIQVSSSGPGERGEGKLSWAKVGEITLEKDQEFKASIQVEDRHSYFDYRPESVGQMVLSLAPEFNPALSFELMRVLGDSPGPVNDRMKYAAYQDADLFVTPRFTGFPLTFLEAMACGLPLLTTRAGDIIEGLDGTVGQVVSPTPQAIVSTLLDIIENPEVQKTYSACAYATAVQYDWALIAERLETIYTACLED